MVVLRGYGPKALFYNVGNHESSQFSGTEPQYIPQVKIKRNVSMWKLMKKRPKSLIFIPNIHHFQSFSVLKIGIRCTQMKFQPRKISLLFHG